MQIHREEPSAIAAYIENHRNSSLEDEEPTFKNYLARIERFKKIDPGVQMLEIGVGTGWFPILCKVKGLSCKGIDISPHLIEYARALGRQHGVEPDLELANIEECDLGQGRYDVIIASSVFEHVEHWELAMKKVFDALRPDGVLFFESTNKYSPKSAEYNFPLYGWYPDAARYALRKKLQNPDIMHLGIDFNQFRYGQLRRFFTSLGFRRVVDRVDLADVERLRGSWKGRLVGSARRSRLIRFFVLTFAEMTTFVCIK